MPTIEAKDVPKRVEQIIDNKEQRVDEQLLPPGKYEITPESKFKIEFWLKKVDDRWVFAQKGRDAIKEEVTFRMWTYDEMIDIRRKANSYDQLKRMYWVDVDMMNRMKVQKLLTSWTLDRENPRLKIHHVGGVMTDESWKVFTRLQPNISRYIIDKANEILEYNGA